MKKYVWSDPETKKDRKVHQVAELKGVELDLAVAKCEGEDVVYLPEYGVCIETKHPESGRSFFGPYSPSTNWAIGGPLVEKYKPEWNEGPPPSLKNSAIIPPMKKPDGYSHFRIYSYVDTNGCGESVINPEDSTLLEALMRAIVAGKYGEEIEL